MSRTLPNIIITGTPGTGKTSHCEMLAERTGLKHISVNQVVKDRECHEGWDEEYQSWVVDEDKVGFFSFFSTQTSLDFQVFTFSIYL
jgi:adenylate kinase